MGTTAAKHACTTRGSTKAAVQVIGALECAKLGSCRQDERRHTACGLPERCEILCGADNAGLKHAGTFVRRHPAQSKGDGSCLGGHAMEGCPVSAAVALPMPGGGLARGYDEPGGLFLRQTQPC